MAGMFDDLIPNGGGGSNRQSLSFDDLIPKAKKPEEPSGGLMQKVDDAVRLAASGATLGYADKLAAYMGGVPVEQEQARTEEARKRLGLIGTAAEVAGGFAPIGRVAKAVELGAGALNGAPIIGRIAASPYAQSVATGALVGAGEAAGHDQDIGTGAALGGVAGVGGQAIGDLVSRGVGKAAGLLNKPAPVPTAEELDALKRAAYAKADASGGIVNKDAYNRLVNDLRNVAAEYGHEPSLEPRTAGFFNVLGRNAGENVTMKGMDTLRKVAGRTWEGGESDANLGGMLKAKIDEFTGNLKPEDLIPGMGDAQAAHQAYTEARGLARKAFKSEDLANAVEAAKFRAGSTGTGGNVENATRQELRKLLKSDSWTPDERAAIEREVLGSTPRNIMRSIGGLSPDKGVIPMMATLGAASVDPHSLALAAGAFGARHGSEWLQRRAVDEIGRLVRAGGEASALQAPKNAAQALAEQKRPLLARGLLSALLMGLPVTQ